MNETNEPLPAPDLAPRPINMDQYYAYAAEKIELIEGYLFGGPEFPEDGLNMLRLLLVNVGLLEAVKLVPEERWRQALAQAYGSGARD